MPSSGALEGRSPAAPRAPVGDDSCHRFLRLPTYLESPGSCNLAEQCLLIQGAPSSLGLLTGPARSTRTSGRIPTLFPMEADIHLASVDGSSNPPSPWKGVLGLAGEGLESADYPGTPPRKTTVPLPLRMTPGYFRAPTAPRVCVSPSPHKYEIEPDNTTCSMSMGYGPNVAVGRHNSLPTIIRRVGFR